MSTRDIKDYLTKQIFLERNIVTYRSLSRHFCIHVNEAKNELARFHEETQSQKEKTCATFQLSGTLRKQTKSRSPYDDDDMQMDVDPTQDQDEDGYDDAEGEEVPQVTMTLVNERDLLEAKSGYDDLYSAHVYSLSPSPINDVDLICVPTAAVREADRLGGTKLASTVGRVVGADIKMKAGSGQPIAGPPKLKPAESKPSLKAAASMSKDTAGATTAQSTKPATTATWATTSDKGKEKQKPIAKGDFFKSAPKKSQPLKKEATLKDDAPATKAGSKGSLFFGKSAKSAPVKAESPAPAQLSKSIKPAKSVSASPAPSTKSISPEPRGVKRKSSVGLELGKKGKAAASGSVSAKKRVIVDSDEEEEAPKVSRRTARRQEAMSRMEDEETKAALALMDIDDDMVEKVSRGPPSTVASALPSEDEMVDVSSPESRPDEDVKMADRREEEEEEEEEVVKPKRAPRKTKPKKEIPIGRNGLKKKRVEKTRKIKDDNGNIRIEDYSDWESVDEEEAPPEPKPRATSKPKAKAVKAEPEDDNTKVPEPVEKPATTSKPKPKPKAATGGKAKNQTSVMQFFKAPAK